jgi:hypothetical protein
MASFRRVVTAWTGESLAHSRALRRRAFASRLAMTGYSGRLLLTLVLTSAFVAAGGCSTTRQPYKPSPGDVSPAAIVEQNASDAFETFFDRKNQDDAQAFRDFQSQTMSAASRQDLIHGWNAVSLLSAKGTNFLVEKVFSKADVDKRWPKSAPPEADSVKGVRAAVTAFLRTPP